MSTALSELIDLSRKRVSFRVYGDRKQYRRPIIHRFDIKGGATVAAVMAENVIRHNSLFRALCERSRQRTS